MIIGVDIGGTNIKGIILDGAKIRSKVQFATKSKTNKKILLNQVFKIIKTLIKKGKKINGVGVGVAGPVDFENQKVLDPPNVIALKNLELGKLIEKEFKIKTLIENDGHLMTLAEAIKGAGKNKKNIVGITLGTGVGGGIVIDKKIVHGKTGTAGEIGHMSINKYGRKCNCGSRGCLEAYVCENGIRKTAYDFFKKRIKSYDLHQMGKKGNKQAIEAWNEIGKSLGLGLANIVDIFNPEIIIIGGGIARGAGELLINPTKKEMRKNVLSESAKRTPVVLAKLNEYAGAIGASLLFDQLNKKHE